MTSFAVDIEPAAAPRLAAAVFLFHSLAAAAPWLARVPAAPAALLSLVAFAGLLQSLAQLPGRHCALSGVRHDLDGWRVRMAGSLAWQPAELSVASRAYPWLVCLRLKAGTRRVGWLLPSGSVAAGDFRRLKTLIRLAC
jgi:hypothetical protein